MDGSYFLYLDAWIYILTTVMMSYPSSGPSFIFAVSLMGLFATKSISYMYNNRAKAYIMKKIELFGIIYNISWEDPRVERTPVLLRSDDVVLAICSAGCNVMDFLIEKPKSITAVDLNEAQLALLDLKLSCLGSGESGEGALSYEDFFSLWGKSDVSVYDRLYRSVLRSKLRRSASLEFWDEKGHEIFENNLMYAGTPGFMAKILTRLGLATSISDNNSVASRMLTMLLTNYYIWAIWAILGPYSRVPREQLALINRVPRMLAGRFRVVLGNRIWRSGNYFCGGYFNGKFTQECCPRYMKKEHYTKIVSESHRVTLYHGLLGDASEEMDDEVTFVSLLDSMDCMSPDVVASLLSQLLKSKTPRQTDLQLFWRSIAPGKSHARGFGHSYPNTFTPHSGPLAQFSPREITSSMDKSGGVGWYLSEWTMTIPTDSHSNYDFGTLVSTARSTYYCNGVLSDLGIITSLMTQATQSQNNAVTFHKTQGKAYDGFREQLLVQREGAFKYAVPWTSLLRNVEGSPFLKSWVCVGCGTAREIEYVIDKIEYAIWACGNDAMKTAKFRLVLVDVCSALLEQACIRIHQLGIEKYTELHQCDVTDTEAIKQLNLGRGAELVTVSYCLTTIPRWEVALRNIASLVIAPEGYICVVDFTVRDECQHIITQRFLRNWFALDGVYLNRAHTYLLDQTFNTLFYEEKSARIPYTILHPTHYTYVGKYTTSSIEA